MFEQEHFRFINMFMAANLPEDSGSGEVQTRYATGIMEHKVVQNLRGGQWRQKFVPTGAPEVHCSSGPTSERLRRHPSQLGGELDKIATGLRGEYGDVFALASGDV